MSVTRDTRWSVFKTGLNEPLYHAADKLAALRQRSTFDNNVSVTQDYRVSDWSEGTALPLDSVAALRRQNANFTGQKRVRVQDGSEGTCSTSPT